MQAADAPLGGDRQAPPGPPQRGTERGRQVRPFDERPGGWACRGYAGTGKTTMLDRFRSLAESAGYRVKGLAPSASAARTLGRESGIRSETLQRYLTRHAGVVEGRATPRSLRELRAAQARTVLVVDESSLASSEQMRGLLRIATALRLPRVVLVGDEKQLDGVEAGKPFAQLKSAGMETAVMDEILRQRDMELREAVRAGLAGEVKTAFAKLGDRVRQAEPDRIGREAAERWLSLSPEQRETAGVIAPTRALRDQINETIRDRLIAEGAVSGPAREVGKLVPRGLTHAEMTRSENYEAGDTVIFNRRYKTLGVDKGDRREVAGVDNDTRTVHLKDELGHVVEWKPGRIAAAKGGVELFRSESLELRSGDKVRFTRNDPASGLTNGQVAAVESVGKDGFGFRLEDGSPMKFGEGDPQLRHLDRAWAATIHAFQGRTVDRIIAAMPSGNANLVNQKSLYVAISRARDRADLVTDDPKRLADQLERATGERIAALDAVAEQAALETGKARRVDPRDARRTVLGGWRWVGSWTRGRTDRGWRGSGRATKTGLEVAGPGRGTDAGVYGLRPTRAGTWKPSEAKTAKSGVRIRTGKDAGTGTAAARSGPRPVGPLPPFRSNPWPGTVAKIIPNRNPNALGPSQCANRTRRRDPPPCARMRTLGKTPNPWERPLPGQCFPIRR